MHRSQGQSLENVGLYLPRPVFGHGQLYVALSRVGDPAALRILVIDSRQQGVFDGRDGVWTVNIVYPEVLRTARRLLHESNERAASAAVSADGAGPSRSEPMDVERADGDSEGEGPCRACEPEAEGEDGDGDMLDEAEVDAAVERNMFAPLRARGLYVPRGELSQQQVWRFAHASTVAPPIEDEMLDS